MSYFSPCKVFFLFTESIQGHFFGNINTAILFVFSGISAAFDDEISTVGASTEKDLLLVSLLVDFFLLIFADHKLIMNLGSLNLINLLYINYIVWFRMGLFQSYPIHLFLWQILSKSNFHKMDVQIIKFKTGGLISKKFCWVFLYKLILKS